MSAVVSHDVSANGRLPERRVVFRVCTDEHFDYRSIHTFKNLCNEKLDVAAHVVIDMQKTRYIDSSGVALLYCLQHWIKAPQVSVQVINCSPDMRCLLSLGRLAHHVQID